MAPVLCCLKPLLPIHDDHHGTRSAITVREDGKPLCRAHIAVFIAYGKHMIFNHGADGSNPPADLDVFEGKLSDLIYDLKAFGEGPY
jgi:hypothetical protein